MNLHVAVISARRPDAPRRLADHLAGLPTATWYVATGDTDGYTAAGLPPDSLVEAGPLCRARNAALDAAGDRWCLQLSDDLRKVGFLADRAGKPGIVPAQLAEVVDQLTDVMRSMPAAHLGGLAPTFNAFYAKHRIAPRGFIVGDLMLIRPTPLRFDEGLSLKEDYDFTCQHLAAYGQVARADWLLADFVHRSNPGGAVSYRTPAAEQEAIGRLRAKWPAAIRPNPRRPNEVLLRWPT